MKRMGKGMARILAVVLVLGLFLCSVPNEALAEEGREAAETLAISQVSLGYQNSAAVLSDGSLWMLLRLQTGLGEAFSADGGKTWHSIAKSGIWGPNARFFIRRLRSGRLLLVNHARESGAGAAGAISKANISGTDMLAGKRNRLAAFLSDDEGKTWSRPLILDEREDVSYPDGVEREDGLIELIYDYSRFVQKEILMAKFREEDILAGRMVSADGKLRILVDKAGE